MKGPLNHSDSEESVLVSVQFVLDLAQKPDLLLHNRLLSDGWCHWHHFLGIPAISGNRGIRGNVKPLRELRLEMEMKKTNNSFWSLMASFFWKPFEDVLIY